MCSLRRRERKAARKKGGHRDGEKSKLRGTKHSHIRLINDQSEAREKLGLEALHKHGCQRRSSHNLDLDIAKLSDIARTPDGQVAAMVWSDDSLTARLVRYATP